MLPYEENRVRLTPSKDNKFGYINASHITVSITFLVFKKYVVVECIFRHF